MNNQNALLHEALTLQDAQQYDAAEALFKDVLSQDANNVVALYSLGVIVSKQQHDARQALDYFERACTASPSFVMAWNARGVQLQALGRYNEAEDAYKQTVGLDPAFTEGWMNYGILLHTLDKHVDALLAIEKVLEIEPDNPRALANRGILLTQLKQGELAIQTFRRLITVAPDYDEAVGLLLYEQLHACDWQHFDQLRAQIVDGVRAGRRMCSTLALMSMVDSAQDHFLCAQTYAKTLQNKPHPPLWQGEHYQHQRIRIGYLSPDFREHPVGQLMIGIIEGHDQNHFETYAFSLGINDGSSLRSRYQTAFEHFHDVRNYTAEQIARLIRECEIDVLIDLAGYTSDSRSAVLLHRAAPIQVNYLGYPGTMGLPCVDYIIADRHTIPEGNEAYFSEQVVTLPYTYLPTDAGLRASTKTPPRGEYGLPENVLVFCAFNHDFKINPRLFDMWMRILRRVPDSVLWLMARNEPIKNNLRREAEARGIDPARLVFASRVPDKADHLARYRLADLFLDATPYNAHTTCADALQGGLPVITYRGNAFPGRVASGLLAAAGLPELAVDSFEEYENLAVELANDAERRQALHRYLLDNRDRLPLFDTQRFCRDLEFVYATMWQRQQQGLSAESFSIEASGGTPVFAQGANAAAMQPEVKLTSEPLHTLLQLCPHMPMLTILDVGAALGEAPLYDPLIRAGKARLLGFEPDRTACSALNERYGPPHQFFPHFVGDGREHTFHETNWGLTGSLFEPNTALLSHFQNLAEVVTPVAQHSVKTVRLDDVSEVFGVDFFKIDVQGAELMIFQNALRALASTLVVQVEVEFLELYKQQPLFADVDAFMRSNGFKLHTFLGFGSRTFKPIICNENPNMGLNQRLWSDAVYVKDWQNLENLDNAQLLKMALILNDFYNSYDLSYLLLSELDRRTDEKLAIRYLGRLTGGTH